MPVLVVDSELVKLVTAVNSNCLPGGGGGIGGGPGLGGGVGGRGGDGEYVWPGTSRTAIAPWCTPSTLRCGGLGGSGGGGDSGGYGGKGGLGLGGAGGGFGGLGGEGGGRGGGGGGSGGLGDGLGGGGERGGGGDGFFGGGDLGGGGDFSACEGLGGGGLAQLCVMEQTPLQRYPSSRSSLPREISSHFVFTKGTEQNLHGGRGEVRRAAADAQVIASRNGTRWPRGRAESHSDPNSPTLPNVIASA